MGKYKPPERPAAKAPGAFGPVPTIAEVEANLAAAPPDSTDYPARLKAIRSIDALFDTVAVAKDPKVIAFYRRRVEQGLYCVRRVRYRSRRTRGGVRSCRGRGVWSCHRRWPSRAY